GMGGAKGGRASPPTVPPSRRNPARAEFGWVWRVTPTRSVSEGRLLSSLTLRASDHTPHRPKHALRLRLRVERELQVVGADDPRLARVVGGGLVAEVEAHLHLPRLREVEGVPQG